MKQQYVKRVVDVQDLKVNPANNRTVGFTDYKRIERSLAKYGQIDPLIVDDDLMLLSGHQRLKSLKKNKIQKVEVWVVQDKKEDVLKAYNRLNLDTLPVDKLPEVDVKINIDIEFKDVVTGHTANAKSDAKSVRISAGRLVKNALISMKQYDHCFYKATDQNFWQNFINWLNEKGIKNHN